MRTSSVIPLRAAAIVFPRDRLSTDSPDLADRLGREESVRVVPGYHFSLDHCLRIRLGVPPDDLPGDWIPFTSWPLSC